MPTQSPGWRFARTPAGALRLARCVAVSMFLVTSLASCTVEAPELLEPPAAADILPPLPAEGEGFVDVALAAGITAEHRLPGGELETLVDAVGGGAAFTDLDDDGWLDLVVVGGPRSPRSSAASDNGGVHFYRNLRNGRFEEVSRARGLPSDLAAVAVAVADVDGDDDRDLYFVDRGPNRLFLNAGDATFVEAPDAGVEDSGFGVSAAFFDMEGDGDLDLYVANYLEYDPRQTAHFAPEGFPGPLAYRAQPDALYRNRGDGTFEDATSMSGIDAQIGRGMSVAATDFDGDGDVDVFVANDATENFLWLNDGSGRFTENGLFAGVAMGASGEQTSAMAADVGDVDGDGRIDLAVSDTAFGALYLAYEAGMFADEAMRSGISRLCGQYVSWGQNLLDFDNDGDLDLFVVNGGMHHLVGWEDLLLRNDGRGMFEDASDVAGSYFLERTVGRGSAAGDYDNDGDLDLIVTTLGGRPHLLRNDAPGDGSWTTLDVHGRGGRDGYGARVVVEAGGVSRTAVAYSRTTYLGQSDPRLHFGLGPDIEHIERITVSWPDGFTQERLDVPVGQVVKIMGGS